MMISFICIDISFVFILIVWVKQLANWTLGMVSQLFKDFWAPENSLPYNDILIVAFQIHCCCE